MAEIILGVKRQPRSRRILRRAGVIFALLVVALTITYIAFRRATTYSVPKGTLPAGNLGVDSNRLTLGASSLEHAGSTWVLRLSGDPYTLGATEARLLGAGATEGDGDGVLDAAILGEETSSGLSGMIHDMKQRWRFRHLADGIPAARRDEMAGMAAGGHAEYQRLVWRQAALDVGAAPGGGSLSSGLAFALGGQQPLSHVVMGRLFGLPGVGAPGEIVVSFVHAPNAIPFARVGWAGEIGAVTGVNGEAIAVALDPATTIDVDPTAVGEPIAMVARDVLERAHSLEEAIAIIQQAHPLGAGIFLIIDGKTGASAVVERAPAKTVVLKPKTAPAQPSSQSQPPPPVIGDFLQSPDLSKDPENDRARRTRAGDARLERLVELAGRAVGGTPEPAAIAGILRDRRAKGDARLAPGNGNSIDDLDEAHVVVIDATALTIWVGEGPGAAGALRAFDLRHELLDEPPRAGATAPIAADGTIDPAAARNVVLARQWLRTAQRLARRGQAAPAADAVARSLALAPELPEAHKVAGDLARAAGEEGAAADHYRRFLELAPADRGAEAEVRAFVGGP